MVLTMFNDSSRMFELIVNAKSLLCGALDRRTTYISTN